MPKEQAQSRLVQNRRHLFLGRLTYARAYPSIRHIDAWRDELIEEAVVIRFLQIKPSIRNRRPDSAGQSVDAVFLQHFVFLRLSSQKFNDASAKKNSLCLQRPLHIRAEIELLQPLLEHLQLWLRPLAESYRDWFQCQIHHRNPHQVRDENRFIPRSIRDTQHEVDVTECLVGFSKRQFGCRSQLQDQADVFEHRQMRQENSRIWRCSNT